MWDGKSKLDKNRGKTALIRTQQESFLASASPFRHTWANLPLKVQEFLELFVPFRHNNLDYRNHQCRLRKLSSYPTEKRHEMLTWVYIDSRCDDLAQRVDFDVIWAFFSRPARSSAEEGYSSVDLNTSVTWRIEWRGHGGRCYWQDESWELFSTQCTEILRPQRQLPIPSLQYPNIEMDYIKKISVFVDFQS